jgi:hypothetical protein
MFREDGRVEVERSLNFYEIGEENFGRARLKELVAELSSLNLRVKWRWFLFMAFDVAESWWRFLAGF